jgi:hypothetical protein
MKTLAIRMSTAGRMARVTTKNEPNAMRSEMFHGRNGGGDGSEGRVVSIV